MKCPFCHAKDTKVLDSRSLHDDFSIRRRRKCESCERRFTTYEKIEIAMPMIVKNDGRREAFSRPKLEEGLTKACQKRPVSTEQIERVIENIEKAVLEINEKEVTSKKIGQIVTMFLRHLDPVAYVRFASVYRNFDDVREFLQDLDKEERTNFKNETPSPQEHHP